MTRVILPFVGNFNVSCSSRFFEKEGENDRQKRVFNYVIKNYLFLKKNRLSYEVTEHLVLEYAIIINFPESLNLS